uniref:Uncharacterized protein n=1 Tax=Romanomermis culicivorax TaxID=13658 RepID=A0A915IR07_ROMCU
MTTTTTRSNPSSTNPHTVDDEQDRFDRFIPIGKRRYGILPNEKRTVATDNGNGVQIWHDKINTKSTVACSSTEIERNQNFSKWLKSLAGPSLNYRSSERSRWASCKFLVKVMLVLGTIGFLAILVYVLVFMNRSATDEAKIPWMPDKTKRAFTNSGEMIKNDNYIEAARTLVVERTDNPMRAKAHYHRYE